MHRLSCRVHLASLQMNKLSTRITLMGKTQQLILVKEILPPLRLPDISQSVPVRCLSPSSRQMSVDNLRRRL